jgi:hypothetical protein
VTRRPHLVLAALLVLCLVPAGAARAQDTFTVTANGVVSYQINGSANPTLDLVRGQTYQFQVSAPGHPFWIKSVQSAGTVNAYSSGVTNNGTDSGTVTFTVPADAPSTLYYNCQIHSLMTGVINVTGTVPVQPTTWGRLKGSFLLAL